MKSKSFFICSLFFPFFIPLLLYLFAENTQLFGLMFASIMFGGIQYILCMPLLIGLIVGRKSEKSLIKLCVLTPFIYVPFQLTWIFIISFGSSYKLSGNDDILYSSLVGATIGLLYGYSYVMFTLILYGLLRWRGYVKYS